MRLVRYRVGESSGKGRGRTIGWRTQQEGPKHNVRSVVFTSCSKTCQQKRSVVQHKPTPREDTKYTRTHTHTLHTHTHVHNHSIPWPTAAQSREGNRKKMLKKRRAAYTLVLPSIIINKSTTKGASQGLLNCLRTALHRGKWRTQQRPALHRGLAFSL